MPAWKRFQDWSNVLLGSPFVVGFAGLTDAAWNAWIVAVCHAEA
jgi:hypothetical protein